MNSFKSYPKFLGVIIGILVFAVILQAKEWQLGTLGSFAFAVLPTEDSNKYALGLLANSKKDCKVLFFIGKNQVKYPINEVIFNINGTTINFVKLFGYKQVLAYIPKSKDGITFLVEQLKSTNSMLIKIDDTTMNFNTNNFISTAKEVRNSCQGLKEQFEKAL